MSVTIHQHDMICKRHALRKIVQHDQQRAPPLSLRAEHADALHLVAQVQM